MFQPGNLAGGAGFVPSYTAFTPGTSGYKTDWNNVAPNVGVAWRPNVQSGFLRRLLGDPDQATVRAGYAVSYSLERLDRFSTLYGDNPGGEIAATRNYTTGYPMLGPGETAPVLLRDRSRLGPPAFPQSPVYPIAALPSNELNVFDPGIKTPYVQSFSVGFQRSLGRDTALEVRYVGNRNHHAWAAEDWNEETLFENGFIDEFKAAQANLAAHVAQGCAAAGTCSFAYRGPGTGTTPLPIYLAYFQGLNASQAAAAASYTSANFRNSAWTGHLGYYEPDPDDAANDLHANLTFRAQRAGGGAVAELLRDESGRGSGQHHALGERHALSLAAGRAAPPAVERPDGERQLHLREQDAVGVHVPAGRRPLGADGSGLPEQHRHPALVQGQLAVGAAVRQGTPVRRGHERLRQRAARRLGLLRDRAVPDAAVLDARRAGSSA